MTTPDYSHLPTPELNKLIRDLSVESRNRYEVQKELELMRRKQVLDKLVRLSEELGLYPNNNIDAKASVSSSEAIPDAN